MVDFPLSQTAKTFFRHDRQLNDYKSPHCRPSLAIGPGAGLADEESALYSDSLRTVGLCFQR